MTRRPSSCLLAAPRRPAGARGRAVAAGFLLLVTLLGGCAGDPVPVEPVLRPVRYQEVEISSRGRVRLFSGMARAGVRSRLSFRVGGAVLAVDVRAGDTVVAGQALARLDPRDYELQLQGAEASLAQAEAEARNAAAVYERVRALYENRNASRTELDGARAAAEGAAAAVRSLGKRRELAQLQVRYTVLQAPVDGAIAGVNVEVNENVAAGQPVMELTSGSSPEVRVAMPEVLIGEVRAGDAVSARFTAIPGRAFDARVTEVAVATTGTATTFPVTVRLVEPTTLVRPGMAAEVTFVFGSASQVERIHAPSVAVGEDRHGRYVFVVEPEAGNAAGQAPRAGVPANDRATESATAPVSGAAGNGNATATASAASPTGVVRRRAVIVGDLTERGLEILSGLTPGDLLVTAGVRRIEDGQRVRLLGTTTSP
ncbi:MAG: efflux RND transporter periplasmic adaptor subunit [Candidatus Binatia bacterium]